MTKRPDNYSKLPDGAVCKCLKMWREADGSHWCCQPVPGSAPERRDAMTIRDGDNLREATRAALRSICKAGGDLGCSCADQNYQWFGQSCKENMAAAVRQQLVEPAPTPTVGTGREGLVDPLRDLLQSAAYILSAASEGLSVTSAAGDLYRKIEVALTKPPAAGGREDLRRLVDIVWQHATESTAVPFTKTADMLIDRAGLAISPHVRGAADPNAWMVERLCDPTFPRLYLSKAEAVRLVEYVNVNPAATLRPLYAAPPAPGADRAATTTPAAVSGNERT